MFFNIHLLNIFIRLKIMLHELLHRLILKWYQLLILGHNLYFFRYHFYLNKIMELLCYIFKQSNHPFYNLLLNLHSLNLLQIFITFNMSLMINFKLIVLYQPLKKYLKSYPHHLMSQCQQLHYKFKINSHYNITNDLQKLD